MKFVLDDQIGGSDRLDVLYRGLRQVPVYAMSSGAVGVRPQEPMPRTFGADATEQRSSIPAPCHHGELVDCGDHHGRWPMIDFLVDDEGRDTGTWPFARFS